MVRFRSLLLGCCGALVFACGSNQATNPATDNSPTNPAGDNDASVEGTDGGEDTLTDEDGGVGTTDSGARDSGARDGGGRDGGNRDGGPSRDSGPPCTAESDDAFCARRPTSCGSVRGSDNCGQTRTANCGCRNNEVCGGGGTPNVCGCESDALFCQRLGKDCGEVTNTDNCGRSRRIACGSCESWQTCGDAGATANVCRAPVNRTSCHGPASTSGSLNGVTPTITLGTTSSSTDTTTGNRYLVFLLEEKPPTEMVVGDHFVALYIRPVANQLTYDGASANVFCSLIEVTQGAGLAQLGRTSTCTVQLSALSLASTANTCDGTAVGTFRATFANQQVIAGSFEIPVDVSASQL